VQEIEGTDVETLHDVQEGWGGLRGSLLVVDFQRLSNGDGVAAVAIGWRRGRLTFCCDASVMAAPVAAAANINVASIVDTEIFMIAAATVCLDEDNGQRVAGISMRWSQELLMSCWFGLFEAHPWGERPDFIEFSLLYFYYFFHSISSLLQLSSHLLSSFFQDLA
jgi:hypothetical protein